MIIFGYIYTGDLDPVHDGGGDVLVPAAVGVGVPDAVVLVHAGHRVKVTAHRGVACGWI